MHISVKEYSDGFYELSTVIRGKVVAITYSPKTDTEDAYADFTKTIKEVTNNAE